MKNSSDTVGNRTREDMHEYEDEIADKFVIEGFV
jgi:hypothetical protein